MRKYQPIWEQIKKHKKAALIAPIDSHNRIVKAVRKEKNKDEAYKLMCAEAGVKYYLYNTCCNVTGKITFTLEPLRKLSIKDL